MALVFIAIGLIERDGLVVLLGLSMTVIALAVTGGLLYMAAAPGPGMVGKTELAPLDTGARTLSHRCNYQFE